MVQMSKKRWNSLNSFGQGCSWYLWCHVLQSPESRTLSYLYTRDIILVIDITKCQRANILPIRARCSVCLEMVSISRMRTAISRGEWQPWTAVSPLLHARRPRGCQSGREKRQDESYGQKSPWVTTLTKLFSKIQANAGS